MVGKKLGFFQQESFFMEFEFVVLLKTEKKGFSNKLGYCCGLLLITTFVFTFNLRKDEKVQILKSLGVEVFISVDSAGRASLLLSLFSTPAPLTGPSNILPSATAHSGGRCECVAGRQPFVYFPSEQVHDPGNVELKGDEHFEHGSTVQGSQSTVIGSLENQMLLSFVI
ncbi:uncharacterized protein DS421_17g599720 [Arachis hypogaea]|nr:uncharacterized protein DS421_17g599720 [Arachis hypogaea]